MSQETLIEKKYNIDKMICLYNNLLEITDDEEFYYYLLSNIVSLEDESQELNSKIFIEQKGFSYV